MRQIRVRTLCAGVQERQTRQTDWFNVTHTVTYSLTVSTSVCLRLIPVQWSVMNGLVGAMATVFSPASPHSADHSETGSVNALRSPNRLDELHPRVLMSVRSQVHQPTHSLWVFMTVFGEILPSEPRRERRDQYEVWSALMEAYSGLNVGWLFL